MTPVALIIQKMVVYYVFAVSVYLELYSIHWNRLSVFLMLLVGDCCHPLHFKLVWSALSYHGVRGCHSEDYPVKKRKEKNLT